MLHLFALPMILKDVFISLYQNFTMLNIANVIDKALKLRTLFLVTNVMQIVFNILIKFY